uniref:Peptide BmKa1 n=1 Tax=Olivierus martensii TaxID=34649 RepID=NDBX_OLIMR|nr:RecName: Full=Peptide BmKa1; AltName: Full=Acidic venom peptide Ka1; AltName: Full=BmK2; AltName: Full=Non-disulfide-bridged peptide 6.1; Short=NDBP-6.1; Flags: Precursor [Mesobuthus martensii]AAD39511.1 Ka1 protein [Mesobuthus martensii]AAQ11421.1 acidic venom peptide [Mesobuthus martensii]
MKPRVFFLLFLLVAAMIETGESEENEEGSNESGKSTEAKNTDASVDNEDSDIDGDSD